MVLSEREEGRVVFDRGLTKGQWLTLVLLYGVWAWVCLGQKQREMGLGVWIGFGFGVVIIKGPVWL